EHRTVDDGVAVERIGNRAAHAHIVEGFDALVQRQDGLHLAAAVEDDKARVARELGETLRRWIVRERIHVARHQRGERGARFGDELERNLLDAGGLAAVVGVAYQGERVAAPPALKAKWPRADRMRGIASSRLRRNHDEGTERQSLQQAAGAAAEVHLDGIAV